MSKFSAPSRSNDHETSPSKIYVLLPSMLALVAAITPSSITVSAADEVADRGNIAPSQQPIIIQAPEALAGSWSPAPAGTHANTSEYLRDAPGANLSHNGPLTSIPHYRGLSGPRVGVSIDGTSIHSVGPNLMDPALSYLPPGLLGSMELTRGFSSVSQGGIHGSQIKARTWQTPFATSQHWESHGRLSLTGSGRGQDQGASVITGLSNQHHRFQVGTSLLRGNDLSTAQGAQPSSHYRSEHYLADYAWQYETFRGQISYRHTATGGSGTPALPMDIISIDGNRVLGEFTWDIAPQWQITGQASHHDGAHQMNNYSHRTPPGNPGRWRLNRVQSDNSHAQLGVQHQHGGFDSGIKLHWHQGSHDSNITNPNNAMFRIGNYNDVRHSSLGVTLHTSWQNGGQNGTTDARTWEHSAALRVTPAPYQRWRSHRPYDATTANAAGPL